MKIRMSHWFLPLLSISLNACSLLERHPQSGYRAPASLKPIAGNPLEFGLNRLSSLERALTDDRERRQYYNVLPWLKTDEERLDLLSKPDYQSRQKWIRENKIGSRPTELEEETAEIIEQKDIALDMPFEFVRKSWGRPDQIETAGNPVYKNERWIYKRYVSSSEGFKLQSRVIYFEGGKVVGWEQIDH